MPELPETETIARDLDATLRGATIGSIDVARPDVLRGITPGLLTTRLTGSRIARADRRAKSIVIALGTAGRVVVTPRFTGALLLDGSPDARYTCLTMSLADGRVLRYHDVRRLGTVAWYDDARFTAWDASLGPEPLDPTLTETRFATLLRDSRRAVKTLLMDQRRLAGVGNIYANEALWRAGVRPTRRGTALTHAQSGAILAALRAVLAESIAVRGTTFRDFRDAYGARGGFAAHLAVYGRAGAPCQRCGTPLRSTHGIEGRQTVWCPRCQR